MVEFIHEEALRKEDRILKLQRLLAKTLARLESCRPVGFVEGGNTSNNKSFDREENSLYLGELWESCGGATGGGADNRGAELVKCGDDGAREAD